MPKLCCNCDCLAEDDEEKCMICGGELCILSHEELELVLKEHAKKAADARVNRFLEDMQKGPQNVPKCPTCGSTNIKPISSISMTATRMLLGPYSKKSWSQFQCNNCGYMW